MTRCNQKQVHFLSCPILQSVIKLVVHTPQQAQWRLTVTHLPYDQQQKGALHVASELQLCYNSCFRLGIHAAVRLAIRLRYCGRGRAEERRLVPTTLAGA